MYSSQPFSLFFQNLPSCNLLFPYLSPLFPSPTLKSVQIFLSFSFSLSFYFLSFVSLFIRYSSHIPEIQLAFIITSLISNFTLITVRCSFFLQYTLSFRIAYCSSHPHQDTTVWTQPQSARTRFPSYWIPVHSMPILFSLCHITQRFFNQAECQHLKFQLSAPFSYLFFPSCCLLKHLPPLPTIITGGNSGLDRFYDIWKRVWKYSLRSAYLLEHRLYLVYSIWHNLSYSSELRTGAKSALASARLANKESLSAEETGYKGVI